jgi:methylmalonyl-CoA/ethylmalonyl-CoA epimerase
MNQILGMPGIIRIDHIGIAVFDLEESINWYESFFGCELISREKNLEQKVEEALLEFADSNIQLLTPIGDNSPIAKFLEKRGQGIQQIAIQISDIQAASDFVRSKGVRLLFEDSQMGANGSKINFLHPKDCGGVLFELVEN